MVLLEKSEIPELRKNGAYFRCICALAEIEWCKELTIDQIDDIWEYSKSVGFVENNQVTGPQFVYAAACDRLDIDSKSGLIVGVGKSGKSPAFFKSIMDTGNYLFHYTITTNVTGKKENATISRVDGKLLYNPQPNFKEGKIDRTELWRVF